jgi:PAS domain S-box-containing protein
MSQSDTFEQIRSQLEITRDAKRSLETALTETKTKLNELIEHGKEHYVRKVENDLKNSQLTIDALFENLRNPVWMIDKDHRILAFNSAYKSVYYRKYGREPEIGSKVEERMTEKEVVLWKEYYQSALAGLRFSVESSYNDAGRTISNEIVFNPIYSNGEVTGVSVFTNDITERKLAEEAIKRSESRYRMLVETIQEAVIYLTPENLLEFANDRFYELTGYSREEMEGAGAFEKVFDPEDYKIIAGKKMLRKQGVSEQYEIDLITKQGTRKQVNVYAAPIHDEHNCFAGTIATLRDITRKREAEQELRKSEERYRSLMENISEAIWSVDRDYNIIAFNSCFSSRFTNIYGFTPYEGVSLRELPADKYEQWKKLLDRSFSGERFKHEHSHQLEGRVRFYELSFDPVLTDGLINSVSVFSRDITEKRKSQLLKEITYNISEEAQVTNDLAGIGKIVHLELSRLMEANTFYMVLYDEQNKMLHFPYASDNVRPRWVHSQRPFSNGLVEYSIVLDKPVLLNGQEIRSNEAIDHETFFPGSPPKCWLGAPLKSGGRTVGLLGVLSYTSEQAYTQEDSEFLQFIATQVANTIGRLRSRQELVKSEAYFRALIDNSTGLIITLDEQGKVSYISNSVKRLLGYSANEVKGKSFLHFFPGWQSAELKARFYKRIEKRGLGEYMEISTMHKDGSVRILEVISNNLLHDPRVKGLIINAHDITERRKYESILKQISEELSAETGALFFDSLVRKLSHALEGDYVFVAELDHEQDNRVNAFAFYADGKKLPPVSFDLANTPCENLFKRSLAVYPDNVQSYFPENKTLKKLGIKGYAGTVLRDSNGSGIGVLVVMSKKRMADVEIRKSLVTLFGSRAAGELERTRAQKRLEVLHQMDKAILEARSVKEIANVALRNTRYFARRFDRADVSVFDHRADTLNIISVVSRHHKLHLDEGNSLPVDEVRKLKQLRQGKILFVKDIKQLKKLTITEKKLLKEGVRSYVMHPLISRGELVGALTLASKEPYFYKAQDFAGMTEIAHQLALAMHDVRQNRALRNSEQKNRAILNALPDIMFHLDKEGRFLGYKASPEQLAIPPSKFMGKKLHDVYLPGFADESLRCINRTISTKKVQLLEYHISKADRTSYYEARFVAGASDDVLCLIRDITDRKQAEQDLKNSQRMYSTLVGNLPGMVYRCSNDKKWSMQFVSEGAYQLTGYKCSSLMNGRVAYSDVIHPDDRRRVWTEVQKAIKQKRSFTLNYRILTSKGVQKWVWEQGSAIYDDNGKLIVIEGFVIDITQQKQGEEKLRFSDDILNRLGSLVVVADERGAVSYISPSVKDVLGYSPAELTGKKWRGLNAASGIGANMMRSLGTSRKGKPEGAFVLPVDSKNGKKRWISWEHSVGIDGSIIGVGQDVTLRRQAEMELSKSNEIISLITNNIDEVIFSINFRPNNKKEIEYVSPQVEQLLGYTVKEYTCLVEKNRFNERIHPDDQALVADAIKKVKQKGSVIISYRFRHKISGEYVWLEESITPRFDRQGKHYGSFGTIRNITERKRAEEELKMFNSLVTSTSEGILVTDPCQLDNPIVYVNPAFCKITGYAPGEAMGRNCRFLTGPDTDKDVLAKMSAAIRAGGSFEGEVMNYKKDGSLFWNYLTISPVFSAKGKLTNFVGVIKDVTERKEAEHLLTEKNYEMNNFVYKASHDLKGPLASIIGVTNLAMTEVKDEYALKFVNFVNESTSRLNSILQDLLEISRVTHGSVDVKKVDMRKMIDEIIESLKHAEHSRGINFKVDVNGKSYIYTDRKILVSIVQNLVDNAIKYRNHRRKEPFVHIILEDYRHGLMIEVKDNGVGIPDNLQAKVFDMFFRGSEKSKGTGLGLYIVKNSVKKLGGFVDYYSKEMEGSSFNIYIPDLKNKKDQSKKA